MIKAGSKSIDGEIYGHKVVVEGNIREALRIVLPGGLTGEELEALTENDIEIYNEDGDLEGSLAGYGTVYSHELVLVKVPEVEVELAAVRAEAQALREADAAKEALLAAKQALITEKEAEITARDVLLAEKEELITEVLATLAAKEATIAELSLAGGTVAKETLGVK